MAPHVFPTPELVWRNQVRQRSHDFFTTEQDESNRRRQRRNYPGIRLQYGTWTCTNWIREASSGLYSATRPLCESSCLAQALVL